MLWKDNCQFISRVDPPVDVHLSVIRRMIEQLKLNKGRDHGEMKKTQIGTEKFIYESLVTPLSTIILQRIASLEFEFQSFCNFFRQSSGLHCQIAERQRDSPTQLTIIFYKSIQSISQHLSTTVSAAIACE